MHTDKWNNHHIKTLDLHNRIHEPENRIKEGSHHFRRYSKGSRAQGAKLSINRRRRESKQVPVDCHIQQIKASSNRQIMKIRLRKSWKVSLLDSFRMKRPQEQSLILISNYKKIWTMMKIRIIKEIKHTDNKRFQNYIFLATNNQEFSKDTATELRAPRKRLSRKPKWNVQKKKSTSSGCNSKHSLTKYLGETRMVTFILRTTLNT